MKYPLEGYFQTARLLPSQLPMCCFIQKLNLLTQICLILSLSSYLVLAADKLRVEWVYKEEH